MAQARKTETVVAFEFVVIMISTAYIVAALLLDSLLGEPRRFHPLVGFGCLAGFIEYKLYADTKLKGVFALASLILPFLLFSAFIQSLSFAWVANILLLYLAIGWRSLTAHAEQVRLALLKNDMQAARQYVGYLVSRETHSLDTNGVAKATVESVLENGNDAIFAAIFWFLVAGAPGVVVYRLVNTLDAMWGYRNARYYNFGWAAARLDDVLNYVPARLTALSYALAGKFTHAINCWRTQGLLWKSPNAGPVMSAGAGSLGVVLGGPEVYHGELQARIELGQGRSPDAQSIADAQQLIGRTVGIWVVVLLLGSLLIYLTKVVIT